MQAAALEGVRDISRIVTGEKHHGGGLRLDGTDLRNRHLVVGEYFQQQGFKFEVRLINLIDQQDGALCLIHGLEQGAGFQEVFRVENIAKLVQALHRLG